MGRDTGRKALAFFRERFEALGDPERAVAEKAYMKSELRFHGVPVPEIRAAARDYVKEVSLTREQLREVADALFAAEYFDLRSAAIAVLERKKKLLLKDDLPWLVDLVREASAWAHVDWLATKVIGPLVGADAKLLKAWARDEHLWVRRTALLAQCDAIRAGEGDFELFATIAAPLLVEQEFFIRKAIGWVLRVAAEATPEKAAAFVRAHRAQMAGLTFREATRKLPPDLRDELEALPASASHARRRGLPT